MPPAADCGPQPGTESGEEVLTAQGAQAPAEMYTYLPSGFPPSSTSNLHAPDKRKRASPMAQQTRDPLGFSTELTTSTSTQERKGVSRALCHPIRAGPTATPSGQDPWPPHQGRAHGHPIRTRPTATPSGQGPRPPHQGRAHRHPIRAGPTATPSGRDLRSSHQNKT